MRLPADWYSEPSYRPLTGPEIRQLWAEHIFELTWIGMIRFHLSTAAARNIADEVFVSLISSGANLGKYRRWLVVTYYHVAWHTVHGAKLPLGTAVIDEHLEEYRRFLCRATRRSIRSPLTMLMSRQLMRFMRDEPRELVAMSPRDFEFFVAALLTQMGMEVMVTPATKDGGRDLIVRFATTLGEFVHLIDTKRYSPGRAVGVATVRALYGVVCDSDATTGIVVTTSRFTKAARAFAKRHRWRLHLVDFDELQAWLSKVSSPSEP